MMPTVGSLFSGIGGFDLGLERAGFTIEWQVENDDYCRRVLRKHWPSVPCHYDIRTIDWHWIPRVDLVCGGFPCQPVSVAGKRRAQMDQRWMWPEFARCIGVLRPRYVLIENVPGILTAGFSDILRDLAACGYDAEWQSISANLFGSPQMRERVFILAYSDKHGLETNTHERILCAASIDTFAKRYVSSMGRSDEWTHTRPIGARPMGVDNGIPTDVDRLRALGNAIVPQIAEALGRMILDLDT